jgi:hypothetical protein
MDRLFSLFTLYDLLGFLLPGALVVGGTYWAVEGIPSEPGAAGAIALVAAFFIAGELVQGVAVLWERVYWKRHGGWPSTKLLSDADGDLRRLTRARLALETGDEVDNLAPTTIFELARAELRRQQLDGRAELMNARYALARGLVTASAYLSLVFGVAVAKGDADAVALVLALAAVPIFLHRFHRFGYWFARQVLQDYAGLPKRPVSGD